MSIREKAEKTCVGSESVGEVGEVMEVQDIGRSISAEEDGRILRRIDLCLLPVMALSYAFQYLDKSALGSTAILGLRQDLRMTGEEYSWSSSIYYCGYLIASYPAGLLMLKWKVGKSIATSILTWGGVLMLTALCTNAAGLLATRFFLGVAESLIAPAMTVVVSMFYKRSEQPLRHAAWFLGNTSAGLLGGLLNFGIGHIQTIAPWKASFVILGGATVMWATFSFFLLPDTPANAWFLKGTDRVNAVIRIQDNLTGIKNNSFKWTQCREALLDPHTWFLVFLQIGLNIPNGGVTTFRSIILNGIGFSPLDTLLLQMAPYAIQFVLVILCTAGSTYYKNTRTHWMTLCFAVGLIGAALVRQLPAQNKWGRYVGTCLVGGYTGAFPLLMSCVSSNVGGFTKKTTVNALVFIAYCTGNIIGPQLFFAWEAPSYDSGFAAIMVCLSTDIVLVNFLRFYLAWVNRCRDREAATLDGMSTDESGLEIIMAMEDKTDKQIRQFRYLY